MKGKNKTSEISEILSSETKLGILFSLQFFNSLNLKQIAEIAGMKEPSAFEHIKGRGKKSSEKGLLELGLIEEDTSQKGRGKYYKLTELANEFFRNIHAGIKGKENIEEDNNEIAGYFNLNEEENLKIMSEFFRNISIIAKNFATYTANIVEDQISKSDVSIKEKIEDQIYINFSYLNIKTIKQKKTLNDIFTQFGEAIHKISEESKELVETEINEKYFVYTFSTSLNFIDPRNR